MQLLREGRIRIPEFQRPLKWDLHDRRKLFESLIRGYPIGTLLFWKRSAEPALLRVGPLELVAPALSDALWVVDGQQRIATLAGALLTPTEVSENYALFFDLDTEEFVPRSALKNRSVIPLTEVLDSQRLLSWLFARGSDLNEDQRERALRLGKAVREYTVPGYEVVSENDDVPRQIFARMNSSGKPMTEGEVFDGLHGARGNFPGSLREVADQIAKLGFGRPDEGILLRAAKAVSELDIARDISDQPIPSDMLERTSRALVQAVAFLERDARIPRYELLPYKLSLVTLAWFFSLHPEPRSRSRELLARWVWRGAVSGRHRGDTTGTRTVLEAITRDEESSVQRLLAQVEHTPLSPIDVRFDFRHASSKLQTLALLDLVPRNLLTGERISMREVFETSPDDVPVRKIREHSTELGRSIANRLIHPHISGGIVDAVLSAMDEGVLASHLIGEAARTSLRRGSYQGFLELRWKEIEKYVDEFLRRRARWDETDRPSLDALRVADDDGT